MYDKWNGKQPKLFKSIGNAYRYSHLHAKAECHNFCTLTIPDNLKFHIKLKPVASKMTMAKPITHNSYKYEYIFCVCVCVRTCFLGAVDAKELRENVKGLHNEWV